MDWRCVPVSPDPGGKAGISRANPDCPAAIFTLFQALCVMEAREIAPSARLGQRFPGRAAWRGVWMFLVTGGAGFIGSNVVADLNEEGATGVAVSDKLDHDGKWRNLAKHQIADMIPPAELTHWLE